MRHRGDLKRSPFLGKQTVRNHILKSRNEIGILFLMNFEKRV